MCCNLQHMTVRISVSLPDALHADLLALSEIEHHSVAAVVRAVLTDTVPKMLHIAKYLSGAELTPALMASTEELEDALRRVAASWDLPDSEGDK